MKSSQVGLYKMAAAPMTKKALQLSDAAKAALIGSLGGAGVGALASAVAPKDEDEDMRKRLLANILAGAAMGGVAGYGAKTLGDTAQSIISPSEPPGWWQRNAIDLPYSTTLETAGVLAGGAAAAGAANDLRKSLLLRALGEKSTALQGAINDNASKIVNAKGLVNGGTLEENAARSAFNRTGKLRTLKSWLLRRTANLPGRLGAKGRQALRVEQQAQLRLLRKLEALAGPGASRASLREAERMARSVWLNPRAMAKAVASSGGGAKKRLTQAVIAALLLTSGVAARSYGK